MASATAELVRRGYETAAAGDVAAMLALVHPEIECHDRPERPDASVYHGHEGLLRLLAADREAFGDIRYDPQQIIERGDAVIVTIRQAGTGTMSGLRMDEEIAHLWRIRDGQFVELRVYSSPADAEAALG